MCVKQQEFQHFHWQPFIILLREVMGVWQEDCVSTPQSSPRQVETQSSCPLAI